MPRIASLLLALLVLTAGQPALAGEWSLRLEKDGIRVESRLPDGKGYEEFRASVEVNAPLQSAIALLRDNSACTAWLFRCEESRLLEQISRTEQTFYQRTGLPFPLKDRDAVFHASIDFRDDGSARVEMIAKPDLLPETRYVRLVEAHGSYLFEPLSGSRVRVTWQQYVDPAGSVPRWLVNAMLTDLPYRSLQNFRDLVATPYYRDVSWIHDESGERVGISAPSAARR